MRIAVLAGGVGGAKLAQGLYRVMDPQELTIIANTGDDIVMHGLHVSPDPDIILYTLAGVVNPDTGWGFAGESFRTQDGLKVYGRETWFNLGDRDLATHIHRTAMLKDGWTLSDALRSICAGHGVKARILPMSDDPMHTLIETEHGTLHLQEYFVREKCAPVVRRIMFKGMEHAHPAPGVIEAIAAADGILVAPSNPLISIEPILAVPGIREALRGRRERVAAICPLVGGKSLKGPTDKMMRELGLEVSPAGVAGLYTDFCSALVIDDADAMAAPSVEALGMRAIRCSTVMRSLDDKERLARSALRLFIS